MAYTGYQFQAAPQPVGSQGSVGIPAMPFGSSPRPMPQQQFSTGPAVWQPGPPAPQPPYNSGGPTNSFRQPSVPYQGMPPQPQAQFPMGQQVGPRRGAPPLQGQQPMPMPGQMPAPQPQPQAQPQKKSHGDVEEWLTTDAQQQRRTRLGLMDDYVLEFIEQAEFISLGNFCGVSRALQAMGVKKYSYPFDWVRTPSYGVIHCLENDFEDFLTFTVARDEGPKGHLFGGSHWGGSFWHHNVLDKKEKDNFTRRVERLYGEAEVPPTMARVFVRAANSTREIEDTIRMYEALCNALPDAKAIYLIVFVDLQPQAGFLRLESHDYNIIFAKIHEELFVNNGANWSMQRQSEAYSEGMAPAIRAWAGSQADCERIVSMPSLQHVSHSCSSFDGGSTAVDLFFPRAFQGQLISVQRKNKRPPPPVQKRGRDSSRERSGSSLTAQAMEGLKTTANRIVGLTKPRQGPADEEAYYADEVEQAGQGLPFALEEELKWRPQSRAHSRSASQERDLLDNGRIMPGQLPAPVAAENQWLPGAALVASRTASPAPGAEGLPQAQQQPAFAFNPQSGQYEVQGGFYYQQ